MGRAIVMIQIYFNKFTPIIRKGPVCKHLISICHMNNHLNSNTLPYFKLYKIKKRLLRRFYGFKGGTGLGSFAGWVLMMYFAGVGASWGRGALVNVYWTEVTAVLAPVVSFFLGWGEKNELIN